MKKQGLPGMLVTVLFFVFIGLAHADLVESPCIKWVLVDTAINPNNEQTEFRGGGYTPGYYTETRFEGKFDLFSVSETHFGVHTSEMDHGYLYWDVKIDCNFDAPPKELIPGESYDLTATFTHEAIEYNEGPRYSQQFFYDTTAPGVWLNLPEGMYADNMFLYAPWDQNYTGENSKTWTLDVIDKGAPFYGAPGDTFSLVAGWRGDASCFVTWTYEAREVSCGTEESCNSVFLEHIFNAGVQAGWAHIRAYWYALEAKPPLVTTGEANEIITNLTALGDHLEASGFPFEEYQASTDSLIAELRTGIRSLDIPEGIGSLIHDQGGLQTQLRDISCTLPTGEKVWLEHVLNAGIQAGWAHIRAYWYALEAKPPLVTTGEANEIITNLTALGDHLEASGFPFEDYQTSTDSLIAALRTGFRSLDIPEGIGSLIADSGGLQSQLKEISCDTCGELGKQPPPFPSPINVSPHDPNIPVNGENQCAIFDLATTTLKIPCVDLGTRYWLDLVLEKPDSLEFSLMDLGITAGEGEGLCATFDPLTNILHVPCIDFGISYWMDFMLVGSEPGKVIFRITDYGINQ